MIEVVKELMPLLQGATESATWLIAGFLGLNLAKMFLIAGVVYVALSQLTKVTLSVFSIKEGVPEVYRWSSGSKDYVYSGSDYYIREFLQELASEGGYVSSYDLDRVTDLLRQNKGG